MGQGRRESARGADPARVRRASPAGGPVPAEGTGRTHASAHRARPRGVHQARQPETGRLEKPRALLRRRGPGDAPLARRPRAPAPRRQERRRRNARADRGSRRAVARPGGGRHRSRPRSREARVTRPDAGESRGAALLRGPDPRGVRGSSRHLARVGRPRVPRREGVAREGALGRMNAERWTEVCRIFEGARALPEKERAEFLDRECAGAPELRSEIESLLAADAGHSFLDEPGPAAMPPRRQVGPYEIVGELGRGGMGVVYEAFRRDQGFERAVAVKLVKRGMDTEFILRRFESERRILGELDHPNIARVFDGGETPDGLPYFVMES